VICITGNGLKTLEAVQDALVMPTVIEPKLSAFDELIALETAEESKREKVRAKPGRPQAMRSGSPA
jgi:hypothetical protein